MGNLFFDKQPDEEFSIVIDFSDRLEDEETIDTKTVTAINIATGEEAAIVASSTIDGNNINIKVVDGIDKNDYKITIKITTSSSNTLEEEVIMHVVEE